MIKGKVMHFEIPVDRVDRAKKFYSEAFGWAIRSVPGGAPGQDYVMATTAQTDEHGMLQEKGAINGGIINRMGPLKHPIITIVVDNVDKAIEEVKKSGGKISVPKTAMADMGIYAYFEDTEGNILGLWQPTRPL
jgi:hypothetical protein